MKPFSILEDIRKRSAEAIIAQSGLSHAGLAAHLRTVLTSTDAASGAMLREPLLEGAHPFVTAAETFGDLSGNLLNPELVAALDGSDDVRKRDYTFKRTAHPFKHQMDAWQALTAPQQQSVLVTSGTGSGKTECFLVPILNELASRAGSAPIVGVEAIMLYPLNALIESQRQRLDEWTAPFGGRLRYALYNSNLPNDASAADARRTPWEVLDRHSLRAAPPPILVTNITMLEYMLIRGADRPILQSSQGKLKWIVLDEAHSLVGAAAAEVALLLRRVMLAFGVDRNHVRFIATSATIGTGETVLADLRTFLSDVAGVSPDRVTVIEGHRRRPPFPADSPAAGPSTDRPSAIYDSLSRKPGVWPMVERLFKGAVPASDFETLASSLGTTMSALATDIASTRAVEPDGTPGDALAPLRIHAFQRAMPGLWSCLNSSCADRPVKWPFGRVLTELTESCPTCSSMVLEIQACADCGEPALVGFEEGGRLRPGKLPPPEDEFLDDARREKDTESDESEEIASLSSPAAALQVLFAARPTANAHRMVIDSTTGLEVLPNADSAVVLAYDEAPGGQGCPCCGAVPKSGPAFRPIRFGAPFLMGTTAPILLAGLDPEPLDQQPLPSFGRRLLSFTDSRQGTARMSAKLQIEAERNFVRSFVYHTVQASMRPTEDAKERRAGLQQEIENFRAAMAQNPALESLLGETLKQKETALHGLNHGDASGLKWDDLVNRLAETVEITDWIRSVWQGRQPEFADSTKLASFLLLREFARRPQRANSIETLGIARLVSPEVAGLTEAQLPRPFRLRGKTLSDWKDYLQTVLTHFVRANGAIGVEAWLQNWIMPKASTKRIAAPDEVPDRSWDVLHWPSGLRSVTRSRPILLLVLGLGLDLKDRSDRDDIEECLRQAFTQLRSALTRPSSAKLAFAFSKMRVAPVTEAFWCPVTRRSLNEVAFGVSPFGLDRAGGAGQRVERLAFPALPVTTTHRPDVSTNATIIAEWLERNPEVAALRLRGAWRDLNDRIAMYSDYARAAEHSAQQESATLREYEQRFRAGEINILNCSTTMEMGVDIGSVSAVMMTNVPPSIANYRQRVGRAGRRGQSLSLAYTFCKDRPLDRTAFRDPMEFLSRRIAAPRVALDSRPIVQRHVNAYLLGEFIHELVGEAVKLTAGDFFGCPADARVDRPPKHEWPSTQFDEWLQTPSTRERHATALAAIVANSILAGDRGLFEACRLEIGGVAAEFTADWESLRAQARPEASERAAARTALTFELQRLAADFLLGALSERGFLPGHGFPTDVVSFQTGAARQPSVDFPQQRENRFRDRGGPQRSLDLAIRDYAPGAEVVVDGLVYESAGVTLNWKRPASDDSVREVQSLRTQWRCAQCGAADTATGAPPDHCPACGHFPVLTTRFLRPAGFTVDSRKQPHNQVDELQFIKPADPEVSTRDAAWAALPDPRLGRLRSSREGLVFYSSLAAEGHGYAICLHCGRAAAEHGDGTPPSTLLNHFPLRGKSVNSSGHCTGNDGSFAIQRNLALGHEITTDVFELQPVHPLSKPAANALVIALREAIGRHLGIEAQDMGFATSHRRGMLGGTTTSLLLFDRAAGGAGFCTSAPVHLGEILKKTREVLDCKTPGCETGCPACVLVSDAPDGRDELDRKEALTFVDTYLMFGDTLELRDRFEPDALRSISVLDEVAGELSRRTNASFTIWLPELPERGAFDIWPASSQITEWVYRGRRVDVVFPSEMIERMDGAQLLALRDFAVSTKAVLAIGKAPVFENGAMAICAVGNGDGPSRLWASRDEAATLPGSAWAQPAQSAVAQGNAVVATVLPPLALKRLVPPPGSQYQEITVELDGPISGFGPKAAELFQALLRRAGASHQSGLARLIYQDPYVTSPLVARLLIDTLAALIPAGNLAEASVVIETGRAGARSDPSRLPFDVAHDWSDADIQVATTQSYAKAQGLQLQVLHRTVPHGRFMTLEYSDGTAKRLVLDQGFGAWRLPASVRLRHDFNETPDVQVRRMGEWNVYLTKRGIGPSYVVAL